MPSAYRPVEDDVFTAENIRNCEKYVLSMQRNLDKAVADNDKKSIREIVDLLAKKSHAVKVLAVWKITQHNQGKYTAGIDGIALPKSDRKSQNQLRLKLLDEIEIERKSDAIKRVYIPKSNGKKRPLGIPTIRDRINQEILRIAIEPIVEYHFSNNNFGFRPERSCHDAIAQIFTKLSQPQSHRYIIEGDIKGCFDNINHQHIINTLTEWKVPKWTTETIYKILKSDIFHNGEIYDSETGTPQGGVISPLLANVALTALDNFCFENYGTTYDNKSRGVKYENNPIVRYADDFVIICKSKSEAEKRKSEIAKHLQTIGLILSDEKTKITHITKGFNFLGFNIRKYRNDGKYRSPIKKKKHKTESKWNDYSLLIKPQKEKIINFLRDCKEVLSSNKTAPQEAIIKLLNPKLIGWAMYYRHVVSKRTFGKIDYEIWNKLFSWAIRRHPNKTKVWVSKRYFKGRSRQFTTNNGQSIPTIAKIPIRRFVKVNSNYRVYDKNPETIAYWKKREYINAYNQIITVRTQRLYTRQKGRCAYCKEQTTQEQIERTEIHVHHMLPRSLGGDEGYSNLRLLHDYCHRHIHAKLSRSKMQILMSAKVDYLNLKRR